MDDDKTTALRHAKRLAERLDKLDQEMRGTIRLCSSTGTSLREIAEVTGLSHMTVKRILEREPARS